MRSRVAELFIAATALLLAGCGGPLSTLDPAGPAASSVLGLTLWMNLVGLVVLVGMVVLWWVAMRRNAKRVSQEDAQKLQNRWIVGGGIILPTVAITLILAFGIPIGHSLLPLPPRDGGEVMRIEIEAHQWFWRVRYPDTDIELIDEVRMPIGQPVDFHITAADVIHSFWVPRLGHKVDAIPGRTNVLRLEADAPGEYLGQCAEFCGRGHAVMQFVVVAQRQEDFDLWYQQEQEAAQRNE